MRETYTKQWEPWEGAPTPQSQDHMDELADLLCEEATRDELKWWDGTPVFDTDRYKEVRK